MNNSEDRLKIINRVKTLVLKHHFNAGNVDYAAWSHEVERRAPELVTANDQEFEAGIQGLLSELKSSHTNFIRSNSQPTRPQHAIGATMRSVTYAGAPGWMFLDVYDQGPSALAGIRPGDILVAVNGCDIAPPSNPAFRFGEAHTLTIGSLTNDTRHEVVISVPARKASKGRPQLVEPKSVTHRMVKP